MTVAILGGGPSGAYAAELLARAGAETVLFDEKLAWEKPCGGGLTWKAYTQYPFLAASATPKKTISRTVIGAPGTESVSFDLDRPLLIYSRTELNGLLLERAAAAGARIEQTRVLAAERSPSRWSIRTKSGITEADFCIVATGARNPLRELGTALTPSDTMSALGYYVHGDRDRIDLQFLPGLEGYIWVFPRCGHLSVGICGKGEPASALRARLHTYMDEHGLAREGAAFYSHLLPALETAAWRANRVAGPGWLATGDAAGLVDPITGEGLYYAIRSADLAANALLGSGPSDAPAAYRKSLHADFGEDLEFASVISSRVFKGTFLGGSVPTRMVQFTRLSPTFRATMRDLFAGTQSYLGLKRRLFLNLHRSLLEIAFRSITGAQ